MFKRVILIISMLITTHVGAHQSGECPSQLLPVSTRLEAYGYYLAELASQAGLLSFRLPEYRQSVSPVLTQIVELQRDLGRIRAAATDSQADLLSVFEMKLAHKRYDIQATLQTGLVMFREARPAEAAYYFGPKAQPEASIDRGVQHPDRPMKRETLRFHPIDGLEDWPYDFSTPQPSAEPRPVQTGAGPGPVLPPEFWDWQIPGLNWPPREKP